MNDDLDRFDKGKKKCYGAAAQTPSRGPRKDKFQSKNSAAQFLSRAA